MALGKFREALTDFEAVKKVSELPYPGSSSSIFTPLPSLSSSSLSPPSLLPSPSCSPPLPLPLSSPRLPAHLPSPPPFSPLQARPKDKDAVNKYNECNKIVTQQAFAKAIAVESSRKSVAESIDLESMGQLSCDIM